HLAVADVEVLLGAGGVQDVVADVLVEHGAGQDRVVGEVPLGGEVQVGGAVRVQVRVAAAAGERLRAQPQVGGHVAEVGPRDHLGRREAQHQVVGQVIDDVEVGQEVVVLLAHAHLRVGVGGAGRAGGALPAHAVGLGAHETHADVAAQPVPAVVGLHVGRVDVLGDGPGVLHER